MWTWLITTKLGQTVLLSTAIAVGALASWYGFKSHYIEVGKQECEAKYARAENDANVAQAAKNADNDKTSSGIEKNANAAGAKVAADAAKDTGKANEENHNVYREPPKTAPVAYGSCVHPVDKRVQQNLREAVNRANAAGGSL